MKFVDVQVEQPSAHLVLDLDMCSNLYGNSGVMMVRHVKVLAIKNIKGIAVSNADLMQLTAGNTTNYISLPDELRVDLIPVYAPNLTYNQNSVMRVRLKRSGQ